MRWGQFDEMMRSEMKLYVQRQGSRALNASCSDQVSFVGIRVCVCACVCVCVCVYPVIMILMIHWLACVYAQARSMCAWGETSERVAGSLIPGLVLRASCLVRGCCVQVSVFQLKYVVTALDELREMLHRTGLLGKAAEPLASPYYVGSSASKQLHLDADSEAVAAVHGMSHGRNAQSPAGGVASIRPYSMLSCADEEHEIEPSDRMMSGETGRMLKRSSLMHGVSVPGQMHDMSLPGQSVAAHPTDAPGIKPSSTLFSSRERRRDGAACNAASSSGALVSPAAEECKGCSCGKRWVETELRAMEHRQQKRLEDMQASIMHALRDAIDQLKTR